MNTLFRRLGLWKCRVLDWHGELIETDYGYTKCNRCNGIGMLDSQGNFFTH